MSGRLERDPVDADGRPIPQWGQDVVASLSSKQRVEAVEQGHLNNYLLGDQVVSAGAPQRPEQYTAEQVAGLSRAELLAAHRAGHLDEFMATPNVPAGGAEL